MGKRLSGLVGLLLGRALLFLGPWSLSFLLLSVVEVRHAILRIAVVGKPGASILSDTDAC